MVHLQSMLLQADAGMTGAITVFVVSFAIGTAAIYAGARLVIDSETGVVRAGVTALLGAIVWTVVSLFVGWIPLIGPLLMLAAWITVINVLYPGSWRTAIGVGFVAWLVALGLLIALASIGIGSYDAMGVPL
ncbi:hypothetical protein [Natronocalculus amylovorans]|uniref:Uncharacterized protein n=1 Tax=Natronocalculus amylovorans TaxID=2917812 RepID=A0AAE3K6V5_9EURY|nr:hypothetical protein [Natronocalculus amylovorans]MCL9815351.1 hypothetical protein [Natronocalculus amylovorans]